MNSADTSLSPDQHAKFAEAERIFSTAGFMSRVLPVLLVLNGALFFGPVAIYGGGFAIIAIGVCLLVGCAFPALTFVCAAGKHAEFKERFGAVYMKLVAEGDIPLSVSAVLSGLSPAGYEHRIRSATKKSVQSPPL